MAQAGRAAPTVRRVLIGGGAGPKLFAHIAEYGDGWIPIGGAGLADGHPRAAAGRSPRPAAIPTTLEIVPFGSLPDPGKLEHFASIGVTECVFRLPSAGADVVLPILDRWAELISREVPTCRRIQDRIDQAGDQVTRTWAPPRATTSPRWSWRPRRVSTSPLTCTAPGLDHRLGVGPGVHQVGQLEELAEADHVVGDRHLCIARGLAHPGRSGT